MSISAVPSGAQPVFSQPVRRVVDNRLDATSANGQPNLIQATDQLHISAGARHALEATMAHQDLKLAAGTGGTPTAAEHKFVFNGDVYQAVQNLQSGQGTLRQVVGALAARGERINEVLSGTAQPLASGAPATTPVAAS